MNKYSIITGYASWGSDISTKEFKQKFFDIWYDNTVKHFNPVDIFVINHNSDLVPDKKQGKWIDLSYNGGWVIQHAKDHTLNQANRFCGWSHAIMTGLMLCEANNTDLIFKEQDCLCFGNIEQEMYKTIEGKKISVAKAIYAGGAPLEQSLMLIKKDYLMTVLEELLKDKRTDADCIPEGKWSDIAQKTNMFSYYNFGYGRSRGFNWDNLKEPFFLQHIDSNDINNLKKYKFL